MMKYFLLSLVLLSIFQIHATDEIVDVQPSKASRTLNMIKNNPKTCCFCSGFVTGTIAQQICPGIEEFLPDAIIPNLFAILPPKYNQKLKENKKIEKCLNDCCTPFTCGIEMSALPAKRNKHFQMVALTISTLLTLPQEKED